MTIDPLQSGPVLPDEPVGAAGPYPNSAPASLPAQADFFSRIVSAIENGDGALVKAQSAEDAFVAGKGSITEMVFERARADALLQIAAGATSHATQSLNTILNMQV